MENIIDPVDVELIKAELTPEKKLPDSDKGSNELYVVTWQDSPNVVREIGRLREISYREAGASSGKSMDLDEFDFMENPYKQLIIWDPEAEAIVGGYRFILGSDVKIKSDGQPNITSSRLYHFSEDFIRNYLPYTMELGRSFVQPAYRSSGSDAKANNPMDYLWDGITSVVLSHPDIIYFFGKMTIYPSYDPIAKDLIMHFLMKHFAANDDLVRAYHPEMPVSNPKLMDLILNKEELRQDYRNLRNAVQQLGTQIPPLVNGYINTTSTMKVYGTSFNEQMTGVIETAIMVCLDEIYVDEMEHHVSLFQKFKALLPWPTPDAESRRNKRIELRRKRLLESFHNRRGTGGSSPDVEFL